jgi:hypothetical protein
LLIGTLLVRLDNGKPISEYFKKHNKLFY